jgi:hypothetical protein
MHSVTSPRDLSCHTLIGLLALVAGVLGAGESVLAATAQGEMQGRAAPVYRRTCAGGSHAGQLCNQDADCPGSTCADHNVFNISVAVQFDATGAQLTAIENMIASASAIIFDATDGQAEIGEAFIYNNAYGTDADLRIYSSANDTWWCADTGSWQRGGSIHVSINYVQTDSAPGESLAHEFTHLVFDARDEYESRAAGCGSVTGGASCPHATAIAAGQVACIMDAGGTGAEGAHSEYCWGQGDPANLTDMTDGNHDAGDVTEQSRCRSNRSCWDQVVWAWPDVFLKPAAAPDPAAGGAAADPPNFVKADDTTRVVLVLDESGSMDLESPTRMERLQVAAKDFVTLTETGTELGIVSYSDDAETTSGRVNVAVAAVGATRTVWTDAVDDLVPSNRTNISAGLKKAKDMITTAGGVTANTFVVLMTDGLNNEPSPQATADAELEATVQDLLDSGIPVLVTCTGGDTGLASQCAEIASGTGGFYVDSSEAASLSEAFVDLHEMIARREPVASATASLSKGGSTTVLVEEGSDSVTFALVWDAVGAEATMVVYDPEGAPHETSSMPQGRYTRITAPKPGEWRMVVSWRGGADGQYVARAYTKSRPNSLTGAVRRPTVLPGEPIYVYAYPRSTGGPITFAGEKITGIVQKPDGTTGRIELNDGGRDASGEGDDLADDGIFTGVYEDTALSGAYTFLLQSDVDQWQQGTDRRSYDTKSTSPHFKRQVRLSATVHDPADVEKEPEDPRLADRDQDGVGDDEDNCVSNYNPGQEDRDGDGVGDACDRISGCGPVGAATISLTMAGLCVMRLGSVRSRRRLGIIEKHLK